jgi:NADH-quinone oxidoreductase subunit N
VFSAAVANGGAFLAVVGVLASAVAAFFYVRVIVLMYFSEPTGGATAVATPGMGTLLAILAAVVATVVLGVVPTMLFRAAEATSLFLR